MVSLGCSNMARPSGVGMSLPVSMDAGRVTCSCSSFSWEFVSSMTSLETVGGIIGSEPDDSAFPFAGDGFLSSSKKSRRSHVVVVAVTGGGTAF